MFLDQCHQALVEGREVRVADEQPAQYHQAEAGNQQGGPAMAAQAAVDAQADQYRNAADHQPGLWPESFGQWQANGSSRGPARQQVSHCPASASEQAHRKKARERHVEHPGYHGQHRP
ncbi:hypothetical protein D3C81_2035380 [compost metagenome]